MLCFCACEEPTRKYQVTTDAAAPDAALRRTFSTALGEADNPDRSPRVYIAHRAFKLRAAAVTGRSDPR
jgi:hypothetical protein